MIYLLDTNICVYWLNGESKIKDKIISKSIDDLAISIITLAELQYDAYNSRSIERNLKKVKEFSSTINIYELDERSTDLYASIKAKLKAEGKILDDFDILIAAIAIINNCILVTNNLKHFQRIKDLRIENWME